MSSEPDRLYVEKSDLKIYKRLKDVGSPFQKKENKELFLMAMIEGFKQGGTKELRKREGYVRWAYLTDQEKSLIKALAIHKEGTLNALLDKKKVFSIAEEHAAYGIRFLHDRVFGGEYGTYAKKLESELVQTLAEHRKRRRKRKEPDTTNLRELVDKGESESIEFKSSMCWDYKKKRKNKLMEFTVAKSVSAFMNTGGGHLLIGVGDNKQILGLDQDFSVIRKPSEDAYELHFKNIINKYLGKENRPHVKMWFGTLKGKRIAVVEVSRSPNPVYVKSDAQEEFYVRLGNSSHPLNVREATAYTKKHWQ